MATNQEERLTMIMGGRRNQLPSDVKLNGIMAELVEQGAPQSLIMELCGTIHDHALAVAGELFTIPGGMKYGV